MRHSAAKSKKAGLLRRTTNRHSSREEKQDSKSCDKKGRQAGQAQVLLLLLAWGRDRLNYTKVRVDLHVLRST